MKFLDKAGASFFPADKRGLRGAVNHLTEKKGVVLIAPEGDCNFGLEMGLGKPGIGLLAQRSGASILAVGLEYDPTKLDKHFFNPLERVRLSVNFGPVVDPSKEPSLIGLSKKDWRQAVSEMTMYAIADQLPPAQRGPYRFRKVNL